MTVNGSEHDDLHQVKLQLVELTGRVDHVSAQMVDTSDKISDVCTQMKDLSRYIFQGNGAPPFMTQLALIQNRIESLEDAKKGSRLMIGSVIAALIAGGASVVTSLISLLRH